MVTFERLRGRSHSDKRHTHELSRPSPMTLATYNALFLVRMTIGASQSGFTRAQLGPVKSDPRFSRCLGRRLWTIRIQEKFESGNLGETKWGRRRALETRCLDRAPSMFCNWKGGGGGALAKESINYPTCLYATYVFNTIISTTIINMGMVITYRTTGICPHEQSRRAGPARTMHGQKGLSLLLYYHFSNSSNIHFVSAVGLCRRCRTLY